MAVQEKRRFPELPREEQVQIARHIRYNTKRDRKAEELPTLITDNPFGIVGGGYTHHRGMHTRGRDLNETPGYNELHNTDFRDVTQRLRQKFPGEVIQTLDIGCGEGRFGHELMFDLNKQEKVVEVQGTNIRPMNASIPTRVMIAENLKYPDNTFHNIVTTSAATMYTNRLDLVLEEMHRITKPGGEVHFQGLPETMPEEKAKAILKEFETKHNLTITQNPDGENAYHYTKPQ